MTEDEKIEQIQDMIDTARRMKATADELYAFAQGMVDNALENLDD